MVEIAKWLTLGIMFDGLTTWFRCWKSPTHGVYFIEWNPFLRWLADDHWDQFWAKVLWYLYWPVLTLVFWKLACGIDELLVIASGLVGLASLASGIRNMVNYAILKIDEHGTGIDG